MDTQTHTGATVGGEEFDVAHLHAVLGNAVAPPERLAELELEKTAARRERLWREARIPLRAREFAERYVPEPGEAKGRSRWANTLDTVDERLRAGGAMMAMVGHAGTGKTVMAATAAWRLVQARLRSVRWFTGARLIAWLGDAKARAGQRQSDGATLPGSLCEALDQLAEPELLVIDQLDKSGKADWEQRYLIDVLDARYNEKRSTVLILNVDPQTPLDAQKLSDAGREVLGESVGQRVEECGGFIAFDWPRKRKVVGGVA